MSALFEPLEIRNELATDPLESGLHLRRAEFERRYELMPRLKRAELINGVVIMGSPVSNWHAEKNNSVGTCFGNYAAAVPQVKVGVNGTVRLDDLNEVQPDAFLRLDEKFGGQSVLEGNYLSGAPELIVEIAASSVAYDMFEKLELYHRHKVREYLVWQGEENRIVPFRWEETKFQRIEIESGGIFRSEAFPGLFLDLGALLAGNMEKALAELRNGLASPQFAAFVSRLARERHQQK